MELYYDRADWHFLGDRFPRNKPKECGGTHIGLYLAWIIENDLIGEFHRQESVNALGFIKERQITGRDFLINECDSKLCAEDLNGVGNEFTQFYYADENGSKQYVYDYAEMFIKEPMTFWDVEDTWENYDKIKPVIDERYRSWQVVRKIMESNNNG